MIYLPVYGQFISQALILIFILWVPFACVYLGRILNAGLLHEKKKIIATLT